MYLLTYLLTYLLLSMRQRGSLVDRMTEWCGQDATGHNILELHCRTSIQI